MKKIFFLSLIISLVIGSCAKQEVKSSNEGVWKVVSWEHFTGDTLDWQLSGNITGSEINIASKNHFLWVGRYQNDTTFVDNWGGGTYTLDGNRLEQSILYCVDQSMVGTKIRILLELRNDTAIQTWPCDENWQLIKDSYSIQKRIRVE